MSFYLNKKNRKKEGLLIDNAFYCYKIRKWIVYKILFPTSDRGINHHSAETRLVSFLISRITRFDMKEKTRVKDPCILVPVGHHFRHQQHKYIAKQDPL
jgi:hypothetical protein